MRPLEIIDKKEGKISTIFVIIIFLYINIFLYYINFIINCTKYRDALIFPSFFFLNLINKFLMDAFRISLESNYKRYQQSYLFCVQRSSHRLQTILSLKR